MHVNLPCFVKPKRTMITICSQNMQTGLDDRTTARGVAVGTRREGSGACSSFWNCGFGEETSCRRSSKVSLPTTLGGESSDIRTTDNAVGTAVEKGFFCRVYWMSSFASSRIWAAMGWGADAGLRIVSYVRILSLQASA